MNIILILIGVATIALVAYVVRANRERQQLENELLSANKVEVDDGHEQAPDLSCCGAHEVCEAETLLTLTDKVIYYDDEELDTYRGVPAGGYSDDSIEEFREVLLTLQTHEVAGWMRSLGLRGIEPPAEIREEALMIVSEFREKRIAAASK